MSSFSLIKGKTLKAVLNYIIPWNKWERESWESFEKLNKFMYFRITIHDFNENLFHLIPH